MIDFICNKCNIRHENRKFVELSLENGSYCYLIVTCPYCDRTYRFKLSISDFEDNNDKKDSDG